MNGNNKKALRLVLLSITLIILFGGFAYYLENKNYQEETKNEENVPKNLPFTQFINGEKQLPPPRVILSGMVFGIIFGFIDNFFLFVGIDSLEHLMPESHLVKAGLGNTYSDAIGAIIGTFLATISKLYFDYEEDQVPLWANTLGIFIGCLLGLYIPLFIKSLF